MGRMLRAYVTPNFSGNFAISLVRHPEPGDYPTMPSILRIGNAGEGRQTHEWEEFDPHLEGPEPTLRLSEYETFALAEALAELQHGGAELRMLRKDYDAERKRVDALIGTLSAVATGAGR